MGDYISPYPSTPPRLLSPHLPLLYLPRIPRYIQHPSHYITQMYYPLLTPPLVYYIIQSLHGQLNISRFKILVNEGQWTEDGVVQRRIVNHDSAKPRGLQKLATLSLTNLMLLYLQFTQTTTLGYRVYFINNTTPL